MTRLVWLVAILLPSGCHDAAPGPAHVVEIGSHKWNVELATTPQQRYQGLSGRRSLAPDEGMLFVFDEADERTFCMRDCYIAIDIAFIGADARVLNVMTMYPERDRAGTRPYRSAGAAQYVLEAAGGSLVRAGVKPGDAVRLPPAALRR